MKYLITQSEHYRLFVEKYKTDRLSKNLKLYTHSKNKLLNTNEMFDSYLKTDYTFDKLPLHSKIGYYFKTTFKTNSNQEYRLDFIPIEELNKCLVYHLAFSTSDKDYENLTDKKEMIELLNRLKYIILDLIKHNKIKNSFCIGGTELENKNNIYKYFLETILGENGFEKLDTDIYDTKFGLYFTI